MLGSNRVSNLLSHKKVLIGGALALVAVSVLLIWVF